MNLNFQSRDSLAKDHLVLKNLWFSHGLAQEGLWFYQFTQPVYIPLRSVNTMPYGVTGYISSQISKNTLTLIGWCANIWFHTRVRQGNDIEPCLVKTSPMQQVITFTLPLNVYTQRVRAGVSVYDTNTPCCVAHHWWTHKYSRSVEPSVTSISPHCNTLSNTPLFLIRHQCFRIGVSIYYLIPAENTSRLDGRATYCILNSLFSECTH